MSWLLSWNCEAEPLSKDIYFQRYRFSKWTPTLWVEQLLTRTNSRYSGCLILRFKVSLLQRLGHTGIKMLLLILAVIHLVKLAWALYLVISPTFYVSWRYGLGPVMWFTWCGFLLPFKFLMCNFLRMQKIVEKMCMCMCLSIPLINTWKVLHAHNPTSSTVQQGCW